MFYNHTFISLEELSDEVLAVQVAHGEGSALETLYDRYASLVLGIALKILGDRAAAEDVLQETFWRVWRSASSYQSQRGSFTGWLFRIVRNLAIDAYGRRNNHPRPITDVDASDMKLDQIPDPNMDIANQPRLILRHRQVADALASLPFVQRQVIELAYFYEMTRQEIAESTGEELGSIQTHARMALRKLLEQLKRVEFED